MVVMGPCGAYSTRNTAPPKLMGTEMMAGEKQHVERVEELVGDTALGAVGTGLTSVRNPGLKSMPMPSNKM